MTNEYLKQRQDQKLGLKPIAEKKVYSIPKKSAKKLAQEKEEKKARGGEKTDLEKWYAVIMEKEIGRCWETGKVISKADKDGWHASIAHVLPKKLFPSVATHTRNYLILSAREGAHSRYDLSWQSAQEMRVWPIAMSRFFELEPDIADNERKYLPDFFLLALEARKEPE